jgi:hypothetical protein
MRPLLDSLPKEMGGRSDKDRKPPKILRIFLERMTEN